MSVDVGTTACPSSAPPAAAVPVPLSGAYFGAWTSSNTRYTLTEREAQIGRKYAIVHGYHDWDDVFPTSEETSWAQGGRILYFGWESRIYGTSQVIPWREIASGAHDARIDAAAARIKALGLPVFIDFMHEPENDVGSMGTAEEFAAAFRRVHDRFAAVGVTNVSWVWDVMGYSGYYTMYPELYPGDAYVDWIGWNPYNWYVCHGTTWKTFAEEAGKFYNWLMQNGHHDKPFMLGEWGSCENDVDAGAKGAWFRDARDVMKAGFFPNLKALVYFDSRPSECDWRIDTSQASLEGYRAMANDLFFSP